MRGWRTSEFWIVVCTILASVLVAVADVLEAKIGRSELGIAAACFAAGLYAAGRSLTKLYGAPQRSRPSTKRKGRSSLRPPAR